MTPWLRILSASGRLGINAVSWLSMLSFGNSPFQPPRDPVEIRPIFGLILRIFFLKSIWLWYVSKIRSSQISSNTPCIQCIWGACCCQMLGHFCIRHWCRSAFPCEVADLHRGISGCRAHCQSTQRTDENRIHQDLLKHTMVYQQLSTNLRWVDPDIINSRTMFAYVYIYIYVRIVHDNIQQSSIFSAMVWPLGQFALRSCQQAKSTVSSTVTGDVKPWKNYGRTARTKLQKHLSKSSVSQRLLVLVVQFSRF